LGFGQVAIAVSTGVKQPQLTANFSAIVSPPESGDRGETSHGPTPPLYTAVCCH
jgi:hypothetical protein